MFFVVVVVLGVMGTLRAVWQMLLLTVWNTRWTADTGPTRDLLNQLTRRFAIRRQVELLRCDRHHEPFATGVLRWRIVLPRGIAAHLQRDELEALLAHELAHLARRDPIWSWIGCALSSCLAIQPLNLLACRRWNRESEFQCDQWSVKRGIDPLSLARCLTQVAGWRGPQPLPAAVLAASGEPGHLSQRVERLVDGRRIVDPWSRPFTLGGFLAAACLAVAVFGFYAPGFAGQTSIRDEPSIVEGGDSSDDPQRRAEPAQRDDPSSDVLLSELTALQSEMQLAHDELQSVQRRLATDSRDSAELEPMTARMRIRLSALRERQTELRRLSQLVTEQRRNPQ
jgi:hypothetical protein